MVCHLQFDHYTIRQLQTEDLHAFFEMVERNRPRLEDYFTGTTTKTKTLADTTAFLKDMLRRAGDKTYFPYVMVDNNSNRLIGFIDLKNIDWLVPKAEIGCYIDEAYAGKGLTTKAFQLFCTCCFANGGFQKLFLRTHQSNVAARRVAEASGFALEGTIRNDYRTSAGKLIDLMYYGKINES